MNASQRPRLLRMLLAFLLVAAPLAMPPDAARAATIQPSTSPGREQGVRVAIDSVSPAVREDGELQVRGRIINGTDAEVRAPVARLGISGPLSSRPRVGAWAQRHNSSTLIGVSTRASQPGGAEKPEEGEATVPTLPETLGARSQTPFDFSVPADQLPGFSAATSGWGPRGLSLQVRTTSTQDVRSSRTAAAYTVYFADPDLRPTQVGVLLPITATGISDAKGLIAPEDLEKAASAPDGRLQRMLDAIRGTSVGLAIDPQLLASIQSAVGEESAATAGGTAPTPDGAAEPTPAPPAVDNLRAWWAAFKEEAGEHTVVALPWADPDLAALERSPIDGMAATAEQGREIVTAVFPEARTDLAWPVAGTVTRDLASGVAADGAKTLVVSDLQQPARTPYTGSAPSTLTADGHTIDTAVFDSGLSMALAGLDPKLRGPLDQGPETDSAPTSATAMSRLLAESAAITDERPYDPRRVLVAAPRNWNPDDGTFKRALSELNSAPWVDMQNLESLLDGEPVLRQPLKQSTREDSLGSDGLERLGAAWDRSRVFSSALADPKTAERDLDRALLTCTSARWVDDPEWTGCVDDTTRASDAITRGITAEEGSPVLLVTGDRTNIPIRVTNDTPYDASVIVSLRSPTPQLKSRTSEPRDIAAGGSARVDVPVEGIANGDVSTSVTVTGVEGQVVSEPAKQLVRVRTDWENIGTAVIGVGLLTVLIFGLITSFRRGRRTMPKSQLEAAVAKASADDPG